MCERNPSLSDGGCLACFEPPFFARGVSLEASFPLDLDVLDELLE